MKLMIQTLRSFRLDFHVINVCSFEHCFRIKRNLRSLHKTTAPRWYECAKIHMHHANNIQTHSTWNSLASIDVHVEHYFMSLFLFYSQLTSILLVQSKYFDVRKGIFFLPFSKWFLVSHIWNCVNERGITSHILCNGILLIPMRLVIDITA